MAIAEYSELDGLALADLVHKGDVSAAELAEEAINRIENHNPALNAVVTKLYDVGRAAAQNPVEGPFKGVPFLLKDILGDLKGVETRSGSRFITGMPAAQDATLTKRFKAAGVSILGKTNVPELGLLPVTESALYGAAHNPWNLDYSTGGSSGGSAAAVAAGLVPLAHANDGGGSIRIPAACCGLVGMKPTRARNPLGPLLGDVMGGLIQEHVVSRSVRDSAAMLDCTSGPEAGDPYFAPAPERPFLDEVNREPGSLHIAFSTADLEGKKLDPECVRAIEENAKLLESLGHIVEEAAPPIPMEIMSGAFMTVWASGLAAGIDAFAMATGTTPSDNELEGLTYGLYEVGKTITASQYQQAIGGFQMLGREMAKFHQTYDIWMTTTLGAPPLALGSVDTSNRDPIGAFEPIINYVPFTAIENATGQPAMSLPLHWTQSGLPVGVMFAAGFGEEGLLYRLAGQLEKAKPWANKRPAVWN